MSLPAVAKRLLSVFTGNSQAVSSPVVVPVSGVKDVALSKPQTKEVAVAKAWADDTELRALATAYKDKISYWVFASDLSEFYAKLDAFNESQPEDRKITVEVVNNINNLLIESRENDGHVAANFMGDHQVMQYIGPQYIPGLRLRRGAETLDAEYNANPISTSLTIRLPSGETKSIYFGMDNADEVFGQSKGRIANTAPLALIP